MQVATEGGLILPFGRGMHQIQTPVVVSVGKPFDLQSVEISGMSIMIAGDQLDSELRMVIPPATNLVVSQRLRCGPVMNQIPEDDQGFDLGGLDQSGQSSEISLGDRFRYRNASISKGGVLSEVDVRDQ